MRRGGREGRGGDGGEVEGRGGEGDEERWRGGEGERGIGDKVGWDSG